MTDSKPRPNTPNQAKDPLPTEAETPAERRAATPTQEPAETPTPVLKPRKKAKKMEDLSEEQLAEIKRLCEMKFGTRRVAQKLGLGRKLVRNVRDRLGLGQTPAAVPQTTSESAGKLDPFRDLIQEKVAKGLSTSRILREIKEKGYLGGRTILADYVRTLRVQPRPKKKVWRRFETRPGEETQFDWSPYRIPIGGVERVVHAFAATLGFSRKTHVRFYPDERQSTLLEAHTFAFADFQGVTRRGVYDRMSTVVLGTLGPDRRPLWHPRFRDFAGYYGYEPYLCKVADPDRKGKDERFFLYLERDFLRGSEFDSFDDLNHRVRLWLDEVANRRVHGTTRRTPQEAWEQERPFLIALPESRYPAYDEELRKVGPDSVISIRGTPYTVPAPLAHQTVSVHLFSNETSFATPPA